MYVLAGLAAIAFVILDVAFVTSNFSYNIVASGSSTTTPFFYRVAAILVHPSRARCCCGFSCCPRGRASPYF